MKYLACVLSFLALFLSSNQINAQNDISMDSTKVHHIIIELFDGMREGDSAKVASVFKKMFGCFLPIQKRLASRFYTKENYLIF